MLRHRPKEPQLRRVLPWLAAERPAVFNASQRAQNPRVEKAMQMATHVASFIGTGAGRATFVGLYRRAGETPITFEAFALLPEMVELVGFGMNLSADEPPRSPLLWFDLQLVTGFYSDWKGKPAVVALARKLLVRCWAMLRTNQRWRADPPTVPAAAAG